ncbi:MAG TPA: rod shape-determining protein MreC [Lachnospiraceae bacterium]|nr:rod shape-determining protein MreC [Lachnospiraceae bacterium]
MTRNDTEGKEKGPRFKAKWKILIAAGICLVLLLVTWLMGQNLEPVRGTLFTIAEPVEKGFTKLEGWLGKRTGSIKETRDLQDEIDKLNEEVSQLTDENRQLKAQARRSDELEKLYDMDTFYKDYPKTGAQVVGLSPDNWYDTFILDKGKTDGIEPYMPVLAGGGLVGHISKVYDHYSEVSSVVDTNSVIYGQVNRENGDLVVVQGAYNYSSEDTGRISDNICLIRFDTTQVDIAVGDEIVTSTLGDIYPPGLPIGTVTQIYPIGTSNESIAYVKPSVSLDQVDMALIITQLWKEDMNEEIRQQDDSESSAQP